MGKEIERKFLVKNRTWEDEAQGKYYHQGYLSSERERVVRVRIAGDDAFLTIKGINKGAIRDEFEYPLPQEDASYMLKNLCEQPTIEKYRYRIPFEDHVWEVDKFLGENTGLVIAEVELKSEEERVTLPDWIGEEVTGDPRYYNSNLVKLPFRKW